MIDIWPNSAFGATQSLTPKPLVGELLKISFENKNMCNKGTLFSSNFRYFTVHGIIFKILE